MEGEDDESADERAFGRRPVWQRILVVIAGAFMNILLGFILIVVLTLMSSSIDTTTVGGFGNQSKSNAPGGLQVNDVITGINGSKINISNDIQYDLILDGDNKVDMTVIRNGKTLTLHGVQFPLYSDGNSGQIMCRDFSVKPESKSISNVLHQSYYSTISMVRLVYMTFVELFRGRFGVHDLAGPIGTTAAVGQAVSQAVTYGISDLLFIAALITVNLGVVNLLPLPALDGGRLVFLLVEAVRRKPVNPKYEGYVHFAGFVLLMMLMVIVSYNDILRLIKG